MIFKSAYLKLTIFYVLIAMSISVAFSIYLYNVSSQELDRGLGRQTRVLRDLPTNQVLPWQSMPDLDQIRADQLQESNNNLKTNLVYFNLLILILSSLASYFLAKKTLHPIEEMVSAQNRFTADASHELRTPLTAIRSEIEVSLRDKNLDLKDARKLLESNLEEVGKLESLSNALLKLARYKENNNILKKVSLEEIIVEAYEKVESLANKKSIEFNNDLKEISINGEKQSLVELFVILLDNAIKYSPEKSTIFIKITNDHKNTLVSVKDQGLGIKSSDLSYIFNRFYRADLSRTKEKIDGYGLGLSIAKNIVDLHKGSIDVMSKPGHGSKFIVKFPMHEFKTALPKFLH